MILNQYRTCTAAVAASLACILVASSCGAASEHRESLWAHDNLVAWTVVPFDSQNRGPEERAQMLDHLGFKHFAYDWRPINVPTFEAEIEALQRHHIDLLAWWFPLDASDPAARATLELFQRQGVRPQLWVMQSGAPLPPAQADRVKQEAVRIHTLVQLAAPYGVKIALYNHNDWFGVMDNQVAILEQLATLGVTDVGIAYNFSHAHDTLHDDTANFQDVWQKIKPYVVAVNVAGTHLEDGSTHFPSQGEHDLDMMRVIEQSGWRGPVGVLAETGGDAELALKNAMTGLDWLAAELRQTGSGGPRPFPLAP